MIIRLGQYDSAIPPKQTPLGITYFGYGMDEYREKRVRKNVNRMRSQEPPVAEWLVLQFEQWANSLPAELPDWIDRIYLKRMQDWATCVGHRLPNGATITQSALDSLVPQRVRIIMHPEPFPVSQRYNILTAGAAYKDRIEVVIAYLDQGNTWMRRCDDLIEWELGNWIAYQFGFAPQDVNAEIGNKKPCT